MALALTRSVGGGPQSFVRFVGTNTLSSLSGGQFPIAERFRLYSAVAAMRLATCPVDTPINQLSTFLQGRIVLFIANFAGAPSVLTGETTVALFLNDVTGVDCVPTALTLVQCDPAFATPVACPVAQRVRYTLGVVWGDAERPFAVENGVNVFLTPFSSATNPTFSGLQPFTSNIVDPNSGTSLRTGLPLNSQVQVVRTLFPECETTKSVPAGSCGSVAATSELGTGRASKSSAFCSTTPFRNTCGQTTPSDFGCFCDECCYVFGDCCPDIEFCDNIGLLGDACHDPVTDAVVPSLSTCVELCGAV